jgi:hypothetical protein
MKRATPWLLVAVLLVALFASINQSPSSAPNAPAASTAASGSRPSPTATVATPAARRTGAKAAVSRSATTRRSPAAGALVACDANIRVKATTTTCAFAQNVFHAYYEKTSGIPRTVAVSAWSPAAQQSFDVDCSGTSAIVCRAGDGARIRFPARAVLAYDDHQAAHFADTHDTGPAADDEDVPAAGNTSGENIPNYDKGTGYRVQCADGMYSQSGGRPGACSGHGGVGDGDTSSYDAPEPDSGAGDEIPNYDNGTGYRVQCADGMYSQSGGRSGACSGHGGVG